MSENITGQVRFPQGVNSLGQMTAQEGLDIVQGTITFADGTQQNTAFTTGSVLVTASVSSNTITFTKGNGTTFPITINTGSGGGGGTVDTGSLLLTASVSLNTITFTKGNGSTFPITVNTGSGTLNINTGSLVPTSSFNAFTSSINTFTASYSTGSFTGSFTGILIGTASNADVATTALNADNATTALFAPNYLLISSTSSMLAPYVLNSQTASFLTTASVNSNTITFTKANGTTFPITVNTGSGGGSGTGFPFSGSAVVTGSLLISGSGLTVTGSMQINTQNDVAIAGGGRLSVGAVGGDEGGEILLGKPTTNTTLTGSGVVLDIFQNRLRVFEEGGLNRGGYYDITQLGNSVSTDLRSATTASYISPNNALLSGLPYTVYTNTSALTVPNDTNVNTVATITIPSSSIRVGSMIRVASLSSIGSIVAASFQCLTTQSAFMDTSGFFYDSAIRQSTLYSNVLIKVASTTTLKSFPTIRTVTQAGSTTAIITKTIPNITTNDINLYMNVQKGGSAYAFSQDILNVEVIY